METTNQTVKEQTLPKNMKPCKTCGQPIAKTAKKCPHCGAKNRRPIYCSKLFWALIVIVILLVLWVSSFERINPAYVVNNYGETEEINVMDIEKKAKENSIEFGDTYRGAKISFTGTIDRVDAKHYHNDREVICAVLIENVFYVEFDNQDTLRYYQPGDEVTVTGYLGDARCISGDDIYLWLENGPTTIKKAE